MPTDSGFRIQVIVTALVALAVVWAGLQTGDWTGLVLLVPLAALIPIVAKLPAERPQRRRSGSGGPGPKPEDDEGPRRY
jgi:hypothetical protein